MLNDKKIILGITASIAAYKSIFLVRNLDKLGAKVQVISTTSALDFVTPLTLATLSKRSVYTEPFNLKTGEWHSHVAFAGSADLMLIAPATANTIAKMANGICDNLLLLTYFSARCPIFIAPAMDLDMYQHPTIQENLLKLKQFGHTIIEPTEGELASGLSGKGRLEEPENIINILNQYFNKEQILKNKKILVTTGPTHEKIDSVRFISNYSSGKMGYAIADKLAQYGAKVELISGPTNLKIYHPNINQTNVTTAEEMHDASIKKFPTCDGAVLVAAVADFKTLKCTDEKLKKMQNDSINIKLVHTKDIAASLGKMKSDKFLVGFALETTDEEANAKEKLSKKNFDFIILNSLKDKGAGFMHDTNKVSIIHKNGDIQSLPLKSKKEVAGDIVAEIIKYLE